MLYLGSQIEIVDGVCLIGDHDDPQQGWVLPLEPRIVTRPDGAGRELPQLQLVKYAGDTASGGFLSCDVHLPIDEQRLEAIREHMQRTRGLPAPPRLALPQMVDGSVRMMLFGQQSPAPELPGERPRPPVTVPAAEQGGPQFVVKMNHAAKPQGYGDERAAFSVQLDEQGATILDAALRGEMSPIGIIYALTFVALRPAYRVHVQADWDRVQNHLAKQFSINSLFYSSQIDEVVDELVESRAITIEADTFVAEGEEGGEAAVTGKDAALDELKEMVLTTFFEPSLPPIATTGGFVDDVKRMTHLFASAGIGSLFAYRETDMSRIDRKTVNATFSERTAVLRTIYPQGHLAGLMQTAGAGADPSRYIINVKLDDAFYKRRTVRVISRAEWEADGVTSINVALTYEGDTKNVVLDAATPERTISWPSLLDGGQMRRDVQVSYRVGFAPVPGQTRPASLRTPAAETITGDACEVFPRDLYEVMSVPINVVSFPWDRYPSVELDAVYRDERHRIDQHAHFVLTQGQEGQSLWPVFVVDGARRQIEYSLLYRGADDRDIAGPRVTTDAGLIRVSDPFPRRLETTVVAPTALFQTVERVYVDVTYDDGDKVSKTTSYEFAEGLPTAQVFSVELRDPEQREISFTAALVLHDGSIVEVPPSVTTDKRILLRPDMRGRRSVAVRAEPVDFAARSVREIVVETLFEDQQARPTLRFADRFTLRSTTDQARFEFDYVDIARDTYRYRVTYRYANGLSKASGWTDSQSPELVVPVK